MYSCLLWNVNFVNFMLSPHSVPYSGLFSKQKFLHKRQNLGLLDLAGL